MKEMNLYYSYLDNPTIKKFVRALIALSYVDRELVQDTYNELRNQVNFPPCLTRFYDDYFFKTYVGSQSVIARIPIHMWNQESEYEELNIPRTNNAMGGWHHAFSDAFGSSRYNLMLLIYKLREEEEIIQQRIQWLNVGYFLPRRRRYVEMEENVDNFLIDPEGRHYGVTFFLAW